MMMIMWIEKHDDERTRHYCLSHGGFSLHLKLHLDRHCS